MTPELVSKGESLSRNPVDVVGGKAYNLLRLAELSRGRDFDVPNFYVIPVGYNCSEQELHGLYDSMQKPLAVRSSSPLEDSVRYSFAGRFESVLNVKDFESLQRAIRRVLDSATGERVISYNLQSGLQLDDRMAVIIQEMVNPKYSGVCYSTNNPENPKTVIEYTHGLSNELMAGDQQGNIVSFDRNFQMTRELVNYEVSGLERVAKIASELEGIFLQRMDIEFAVSYDGRVHIVQARPLTDPAWPDVQMPEVDKSRIVLKADIVQGSGSFTGPVFVFISPTEMEKYAAARNIDVWKLRHDQWNRLKDFNRKNPDGYCLITDNMEAHKIIMEGGGLSNMQALITVGYASRFSHPAKVVSETGAFYLGVLGRKDLLDQIDTGDTLTVLSNQERGIAFDLVKPVVEQQKIDLERTPIIPFQTAIGMRFPSYEEVDDRLFIDATGGIGVKFWDYNEEGGIPTEVYYDLVDTDGNVLKRGEYIADEAIYRYPDFPTLLRNLLRGN